jgi:hypothetical protein
MELIGAGEVGATFFILLIGIVIAVLIDDDDLPGPRRARVPAMASSR